MFQLLKGSLTKETNTFPNILLHVAVFWSGSGIGSFPRKRGGERPIIYKDHCVVLKTIFLRFLPNPQFLISLSQTITH